MASVAVAFLAAVAGPVAQHVIQGIKPLHFLLLTGVAALLIAPAAKQVARFACRKFFMHSK